MNLDALLLIRNSEYISALENCDDCTFTDLCDDLEKSLSEFLCGQSFDIDFEVRDAEDIDVLDLDTNELLDFGMDQSLLDWYDYWNGQNEWGDTNNTIEQDREEIQDPEYYDWIAFEDPSDNGTLTIKFS